ncbi:MAG: hypothetical protein NW218_09425 [Saprospiraceae bacterium]|nr:hypothetical protein [Saprospiraceae bacterium]
MAGKIKYIGLALGLFSTTISFLFFGRQNETYQILLFCGLFLCLISYLTILISKKTIKSKIVCTLFVVLAATIQWLTEPLFIKSSYLFYIKSNAEKLLIVNNMLEDKPGDIQIFNDTITDKSNLLTQAEKDSLVKFRQELNVYMIAKTDHGIYYGLWGFLDERIGLTYWENTEHPIEGKTKLKDYWYY